MSQEETILTKVTPASLIKSMQFFIGLVMGLATLWYSSTQWEKHTIEMLFEIRELRKEYTKMSYDIKELSKIVREHEKIIYNIKRSK